MFRVIAVDDEIGSLNRLERISKKEPRITSFKTFSTTEAAIEYAENNPVDIALLDIEMPDMNGLDLAHVLMKTNPYLDVIFVTAYSQYALEAFQAHATGYLLKPIASSDLSKQLDILELKRTPEPGIDTDHLLHVQTFGPLLCYANNQPDQPVRFRTVKAEELFAFLIYNHQKPRSKEYIIENLWPDSSDFDKASNNFRVTCSYIRNAFSELGYSDVLLRSKAEYYINTNLFSCDLYVFKAAMDTYHTLDIEKLAEVTDLYKGEFLENKLYDWVLEPRHWYETTYLKMQMRRLNHYVDTKDYLKAEQVIKEVLFIDPFNENILETAIRIRIEQFDFSGAKSLFTGYKQRLAAELGEKPSSRLTQLISGI